MHYVLRIIEEHPRIIVDADPDKLKQTEIPSQDASDKRLNVFCFEKFKKLKFKYREKMLRVVFVSDEWSNFGGFAMSWATHHKAS